MSGRRGPVRWSVVLLALLGLPAGAAVAQGGGEPEPGSHLTVYLMTMGPGQEVWERFGHNAIRIRDARAGTDIAYNYGLFDLGQEGFLARFIQGRMWYWMAGFPTGRYVGTYVEDNRSVWQQELNLAPRARLELQRFLHWNEQPENRYYFYDYYRDNCSTRVRDAIDRVIGGRIHETTAALPTGTTFRFHTQRLTANDPPIFTGLLLALGPGVDRPISAWEEMFLPVALREHIRRVTVRGPDGAEVALVRSEETLFESSAVPPPDRPPPWLPVYLLLGALYGGTATALGRWRGRSAAARAVLSLLLIVWGAVVGGAGLVLAGLWGATDHVMAYYNENLLQVNPLALALLVLGPWALVRGGRSLSRAQAVALVLAGLGLLGYVLQAVPGLDQVNGPIIAFALPVHLGIALALSVRSRPPA